MPTSMTTKSARLPQIRSWLYQLQQLDPLAVAQTDFDLLVTDYSADGSPERQWSAAQVAALQSKPDGSRRVVLSYLSIGEAEDYRFYWQPAWDANQDGLPDSGAPKWLDQANPEWCDLPNYCNYKVRFWLPDWQALIFGSPQSYLDQIMAAGFDGVYLDIVDGYYFYEEQGRKSAAAEMAQFVANLAAYARRSNPNFVVFTQNAAELIDEPPFWQAIDGVGREDLWYLEEQTQDPQEWSEAKPYLQRLVSAGKPVLVVDYVEEPTKVRQFYARARAAGFVPYATRRDLDVLTINPE